MAAPLPAAAGGRDRGRDGTTAGGTAGTAGGNADGEPRQKGMMADDRWVPRGEPGGLGRRFPCWPIAPFPGVTAACDPGRPGGDARTGRSRGQPARWTTLWIAWGGHGASLWMPAGKACEFRRLADGKGLRNCAVSIHRLWKTILCRRSRRSALSAPRRACPVTPRRGHREITPPGGPAGHGRGPLPSARSAGGSAGGLFGGPALLLAGWLLVGGFSAPGGPGGLIQRGDVPVRPAADEALRVVEVLVGGQQVRVRPYRVPPGAPPDVGQLAPDEGRLAQLARP